MHKVIRRVLQKFMLVCILGAFVHAQYAIDSETAEEVQMKGEESTYAKKEVTPEETQFYKKIRVITDEIDVRIEEMKATDSKDPEKANLIRKFVEFLDQNNMQILHDTYLSQVFRYSGDLYDLLDVPSIAESISDKLNSSIIIKRAVNISIYDMHEKDMCFELTHPNIVQTYFSYESQPESYKKDNCSIIWLFQENLEFSLTSYKNLDTVDRQVIRTLHRTIIKDVAEGLAFMHSKRIVHLDLKTMNIIGTYSKKNKRIIFKIIDLGFARKLEEGVESVHLQDRAFGTYGYMPPEIYYRSVHGYAADIWCLGIFASDVGVIAQGDGDWIKEFNISKNMPGQYKKEALSGYECYIKFLAGEFKVIISPETPLILADFIHKCVNRADEERASISEILKHPYLSAICMSDIPEAGANIETYSM
ncbi:death-associated protein kinase [Nematocida ausubeli]|nr:death-associated protein kinase [Nematocida ausubeli]